MQLIGRTLSRKLPALAALALGGGCTEPEVLPVPTTIEISPSAPVLAEFGDTVRLTATVKDQNGEAMPWVSVTWTGIGMFVAHVSEDGLVTASEPGTARVRASAEEAAADVGVVVQPGPRAVLHKFYRRMGGDDWVRNTGWKTDRPLNHWFGVSTSVEGDITVLSLPNNGLTGEIPREVGSLSSLLGLWLSGNVVRGEIPPELGNLPSLWGLYLYSNRLAGPVPGEMGNISPLIVLDIAQNPLSGTLPRDLMQLRLRVFYWNDTDLCAPVDIAFQDWLNSIPSQRGNRDC